MLEFNATFFVAIISFVVFIFIMNAIFYRPVLSIMKKREEYINSNYAQSKELENKACSNTTEYNNKLEEVKELGRKEVARVQDEIQKKSFAQIQQAKEIAKIELQKRKDSLALQEYTLQERINNEVTDEISSILLSKILKNGVKKHG